VCVSARYEEDSCYDSIPKFQFCCRKEFVLPDGWPFDRFCQHHSSGASRPAYAGTLIYEGTYSTGSTYYAYENSGTQIETAIISMAPFQAQFSHPNDYIIINAITPEDSRLSTATWTM